MNVKCVLCDKVEEIKDDSIEAKMLRNRRTHMYICQTCDQRITDKTLKRHATGNFNLYSSKK